jgi:hypothetical protein
MPAGVIDKLKPGNPEKTMIEGNTLVFKACSEKALEMNGIC